jgi:GNAT superfamily N-acetyltransferase
VNDAYSVSVEGAPSEADEGLIDAGLERYGMEFAPQDTEQPLSVMLRSENGRLVGGLIGETGRGWLYIRTLWIEETARGRGHGRQLMQLAEEEALRRGCHSARLSTQSYEARPFYEHLGYEVFGVLSDYPTGHQKYFLQTRLA